MSSMTLEQKKVYAEQAALDLGVGKLTADQWVEVLNAADKAGINKILTTMHQVTRVQVDAPIVAQLNTVVLSGDRDAKIRSYKEGISRHMNEIRNLHDRVRMQVRDAVAKNKELQLLESGTNKRVLWDEVKDVLADGWYTYHKYSDHVLSLLTPPIILKYKTNHVDLAVPMGRYEACIKVDTAEVWVNRYSDNLNPQGCMHPHIDSGGDVCFGNMYDEVAKMQVDQKYGRILQILRGIITSYNPDSPYRSLGEFNEEVRPPAPFNWQQYGDVRVQQFGEKVIAVPRHRVRMQHMKNILFCNQSNYFVRAFRIMRNVDNERVPYTPYLFEIEGGYGSYDTTTQTNPADYWLSREVDPANRWEGYVPRTVPTQTVAPQAQPMGERRLTWSQYSNLSTEEVRNLPTHPGPGHVLVLPPQGSGLAHYIAQEAASSTGYPNPHTWTTSASTTAPGF